MHKNSKLLTILALSAIACSTPPHAESPKAKNARTTNEKGNIERTERGLQLRLEEGTLNLEVCSPRSVRVMFSREESFFKRRTLATEPRKCAESAFEFVEQGDDMILSTDALQARVSSTTGQVTFLDRDGQVLLQEDAAGKTLMPADVMGERTNHVAQLWKRDPEEALYGLGENQSGLFNLAEHDLDLWQHNGVIVVPFLVSSRGWGLLWDNTSFTRLGDLRQLSPIPPKLLRDADGQPGGLTGSYFEGDDFQKLVGKRVDRQIHIKLPGREQKANSLIYAGLPEGPASVRWEGHIIPEKSGKYTFEAYYNGDAKLWIDGKKVIDHYRQFWLPWKDVAQVHLDAGKKHTIRLDWVKDRSEETVELKWKPPSEDTSGPTTSLWSEVGEGIDYTFVYGPELDDVVAGYRKLTGPAPMIPKWALGLWQSRQRYETAQQSLDVVREFRKRKIPFDNIVQDWFYWKEDSWGSHEFDPKRFPDPQKWIDDLHAENARVMISVWPKFYPGTRNYEELRKKGYLYHRNIAEGTRDWVGPGYPYTFYDAFDEGAGRLFWKQMKRELYDKGFDAFWMDAPEPDLTRDPSLEGQRQYMHPTAQGSGARMLNAYALYNSRAVYEGQRQESPDKRVFILTRSGFAGQQRYGAAVWSGDITSTWTAMRQQIPAGLSMSLSGIPYWTMDVGGFSVPERWSTHSPREEDAEEWRELNTRWFQFGTFVPLLRAHGEAPYREMWEFGGDKHPAYAAHLKFDRIRYRLLPYIYSLAAQVTHEGGTIMRPLVMDFRSDERARVIDDQYMFGRALMVSPVTEYRARERRVYLPRAPAWYDFWSGEALAGETMVKAPAPYDSIPIHVRAGSIIPLGPEIEFSTEKPADPITLWLYTGADGDFVLYEDDGLTHDYEKGKLSRIALRWDEKEQTLSIGARQGAFPGMLQKRTFQIVVVSPKRKVGFSFSPTIDKSVVYDGSPLELSL